MKKLFFILLSTITLLGLLPSCKEGCTNATALNYNRSAKVDNGTCLYCDSSMTYDYPVNTSIRDYNSSSSYYNQYVIYLSIVSSHVSYGGNGCKILGHNNSNDCFTSNFNATFQNNTNKTIVFSGTIPIQQYGNNITKYFNVTNLSISPYGSAALYLGQGDCLNQSGFYLSSLTSSTLQYY